jgi:hypothetical protein
MRYKKISRGELRAGMIVKTPKHYFDEDGKKKPLADIWPGAPAELSVRLWDLEDGESLLVAVHGSGAIDLNTADYPATFEVRETSIRDAKPRERRRRGGTTAEERKGRARSGEPASISRHLARAVKDSWE